MKIVLTGGGTAGHIIPNIALLPTLGKHFTEIDYLGSEYGMERALIAPYSIPFYNIPCEKLRRSLSFKNLLMPFKVLRGIGVAKKILQEIKPDIVFSKGGFVSVPVVIAAHQLKIPIISHESDISMGLANRFTSRYATVIATTFESTAKAHAKAIFTGSPIRETLYHGKAKMVERELAFSKQLPVLLIMGGSSGSTAINAAILNALPLFIHFNIIHIVGKGNMKKNATNQQYRQIEFTSKIADYFAYADIIISRAGSNTICELLALHKPMLLIPLPASNSRGDQLENAAYFTKLGYAKTLLQENMTAETLAQNIEDLYAHRHSFISTMSQAKLTDGTQNIVQCILQNV